MTPEQIAEGRRLKAAANEALEMGEHVSVRDAQKAVDAWDRWLDGNMDALLAAAERAAAAERELSEAREDSARLDWLDARQPTFAVGRGPSGKWAVFGPTNIGGCGYSDVRAAIDAERGKA